MKLSKGTNQVGTAKPCIAVIGLGYVGLPLAVEFAKKGHEVIGFDINRERIAEISNLKDSTGEVTGGELLHCFERNLSVRAMPDGFEACNIFIITVPTPVDNHNVPDLKAIRGACRMVGALLNPGAIVVLESTVYPGCTEQVCVPILEDLSGLKLGDFHVAYSPERVNPGDRSHRLPSIRKIVSASSPEALDRVADLYQSILDVPVYRAPSIRVAEAAKAIENAQRDINIAFVNELAMMFDRMNLDTKAVLEAAGTKWNFLNFKPGLVGGHCIGVDPYYLAYEAAKYGYHPEILLAGRRVNESVAAFIARKLFKAMVRKKNSSDDFNVLVLGMTFKENCPDKRNSKVPDVVRELSAMGCNVAVHDPVVDVGPGLTSPDYVWDGIIVAVAHEQFRTLDYAKMKRRDTVLLDVKGIVPKEFVDLRL